MALTVVVAPDSFKGSLTASRAASAIAGGWLTVRPDDTVVLSPQADGGEGTLDTIEAAVPRAVRRSAGLVTGPDGRPTPGEWLELPGGIAVVELAQASGLPLMQKLDPLGATTRGLGEVIRAALASGATSLVIALGGSASTDGGLGALSALGARPTDATGSPIPDGGGALAALAACDLGELVPPPSGGVTLLTDVTAPLLGPTGAAAIFGPQKGADAALISQLDAALANLAAVIGGDADRPGSGAAGGTAFGFATVWGAQTRPGAEDLAHLTGLGEAIAAADIVLMGEGRFDEQSLGGKVASSILAAAAAGGTVPGIIAGQVAFSPRLGGGGEVYALALSELAGSADEAMRHPETWLREAGARAARELPEQLSRQLPEPPPNV